MKNFILIDEVQMRNEFERAINGLYAEEKFKLIYGFIISSKLVGVTDPKIFYIYCLLSFVTYILIKVMLK